MFPSWLMPACVATVALLLLGGFFLGFSGSVDDAHISYWSAWVLAHHGEMVNYNFDRVEQSSALLQVLLLAVLHKITSLSVVTLGHLSTVFFSVMGVFLTARLAVALWSRAPWVPVLFLATSPFYVYWAFGGMEAPLLACLLLAVVMSWSRYLGEGRQLHWVVALAVLVQLSRPEQLLVMCVAALLIGGWCAITKSACAWTWRRVAILFCVQLGVAATILVLRYGYFGDYWPQPVSVKTGGSLLASVLQGVQYGRDALACAGLWVPALLVVWGVCRLFPAKTAGTILPVLGAVLSASVAFVIASGGDWMPAGRFWVPVLPLFALLAGGALQFSSRRTRGIMLCAVVLAHVVCLWRGTVTDMNGVPLWKQVRLSQADQPELYSFFERHGREHLHDIPTLAYLKPLIQTLLVQRPADTGVTLVVGQAGMVMYHLGMIWPGRLHVMDRNGLTDRAFSECPVTKALPRTRNGLGLGYEWLVKHEEALMRDCQIALPDIVFDIDAGWNRRNLEALKARGYIVVYYQSGHVVEEGDWLPLRQIGAGQYIAVSAVTYRQLGSPSPQRRVF